MAHRALESSALALALLFCSIIPRESLAQQNLIFALKFDEGQGANVFADASGFGNDGQCRMSGASCPQTGNPGTYSFSAYFAASCPRMYGSSVDGCDYAGRQPSINNLSPGQRTDCYFSKEKIMQFSTKLYSLAASCGSVVAFNPVTFQDGTIMMWYKEAGLNDGNPQQLFNPLANHAVNPSAKTILRSPADFGFDLGLVGGRCIPMPCWAHSLFFRHVTHETSTTRSQHDISHRATSHQAPHASQYSPLRRRRHRRLRNRGN